MNIPVFVNSKSLDQLALELAVAVGYAEFNTTTGESELPTGETLRKLRQAVNDGYERMVHFSEKWRTLVQEVTLTMDAAGTGPWNINDDASLFAMPIAIQSAPVGNWQYLKDQNSVFGEMLVTSWEDVNRRFAAAGSTTGTPNVCAFTSKTFEDQQGRSGLVMKVFPAPDANYQVSAQFRITPFEMVMGSDRHVFGREHDRTIRLCAKAEWRKDDEEAGARDLYERDEMAAQEALARSLTIDRRRAPAKLGAMRDPSGSQGGNPRWSRYRGVETYNGSTINPNPLT